MTSMAPLRCTGIKQAMLSDDGEAVLLELAMANGKLFPLELDANGVVLLTRALLVSAQALGDKQPARAPMTTVDAASPAIPLPVQDVRAATQAGGTDALMVRAGCLDLALGLPDTAATKAILRALRG